MTCPIDPADSIDPAAFERGKAAFLEGLRCHGEGRLADAVAHYTVSLVDVPGRASTLTNLAAARLQLGQAALALDDAQAALDAEPDNRDAMLHRATALAELRRVDEALRAFRALVVLDPDLPAAWMCIGNLLMEQGSAADAVAAFDRALERGADAGLVRFHRAAALAATRSVAGDAANGHVRASGDVPAAPPRAYVESLFDRYAAEFDRHLVTQLGYDAPRRLVDQLGLDRGTTASATGAAVRVLRALDLGCGTGLCAPRLRPFASRLVGVDLSAAMLARARSLGLYDRLDQDDIAAWLGRCNERFDLVVAADVFIYVGALEPVFAGVARVLDDAGRFAFTLEAMSDDEARAPDAHTRGFTLRPTLRYAHALPYVEALGRRHAMRVVSTITAAVRRDHRGDIAGHYVVMQRT